MSADFIDKLTELLAIIEQREYDKLAAFALDVPEKFNWVRDVFEPLIVNRNAGRNMLEIVSAEGEMSTLTYRQGLIKCNRLLNLLRRQNVRQGDSVFIMCGLHEGLWITYLAGIKGGFILIPAASILSASDLVYRFEKARPNVI